MLRSKKTKILHFSAKSTCICPKNVVPLHSKLIESFSLRKISRFALEIFSLVSLLTLKTLKTLLTNQYLLTFKFKTL